ncbi:MAG: M1 family metallopeptidase [Ilumatobacteraceae bacterium]
MTRSENDLDPHRLPRHVLPQRYDVELEPNLGEATFTGRVVVSATATEATRQIVLNTAELDIRQVFVDGQPTPFRVDEETERLFIGTIDEVIPGPMAIDIEFAGVLNDKLRGFYRSTYRNDDGVEHVIACTQMQATDCRRAFPCFDEPDFKAVFSVTLIVDDGLLAVSNGPEIGRHERNGKVAVSFADTMPMSTYLVAFVVGRLDATPAIDVGGVPLRIVHVPGKAHLTEFGLDVGAASLRWFTDYYGIPYADAKIDMIALPDFAAGAMENVGCITYRESLLLVDPATSTQVERELVADVVSHELAHMWFGDLVTMKWWNGIWLNEAFATFMEVAAVDAYRPDWERWTSFSLERSVAFETDSLVATRSVEYEVRTPEDCEGMFDVLTYQKGGALLRMLEQYLGPDRFREGVRRYLTTHSYGNTETSDLWDSIEAAVSNDGGEPVRRIMDSWIWQPGYPLVSASVVQSPDGARLRLDQQRFLFDTEADVAHQSWLVPIHLRVGSDESRVLLDDEPLEIPLRSAGAVVINAGGHGFYRVAYSPELLSLIDRSTLASSSTIERYNLVDDAWNAVVAGRLSASDYLAFLDAFVDERELAVWQVMANGLRALGRLLEDAAYETLRSHVRRLGAPALADLGWDPVTGENDLRGKLRGLLVTLVAVNGADATAIDRCRVLLRRSHDEPNTVHPELVAAATTVVAAHGDTSDYDDMVQRFLDADTPQEQLRYLYALAEFDSSELLRRTCEFALGPHVKTQNAPFLLGRCIANRRHGRDAWEFVRRHWNEANERFPSNTIVRMIDPVKLLNTSDAETDVQAFFSEHPIPQAAKTLDQILERQRVNVALRGREELPLASHLA